MEEEDWYYMNVVETAKKQSSILQDLKNEENMNF